MRITDALIAEVEELVTLGVPPLVAVMAQGATERDFADWMSKGSLGGRSAAVRLRESISRAEARSEAILIGKVRSASTVSWQAAAWLAERRFPERYVRQSVSRREGDESGGDGVPGPDRFAALDNVRPIRS